MNRTQATHNGFYHPIGMKAVDDVGSTMSDGHMAVINAIHNTVDVII